MRRGQGSSKRRSGEIEAEAIGRIAGRGVRALEVIDEVGEVGPEAVAVDAGDPGEGALRVGVAEGFVVAEVGAGDGVLLGEAEGVGEGDVIPDVPGLGEVVDAEGFDEAEVPGLVLLPQPGTDRSALGEIVAGMSVRHGEVATADAGGADGEGDVGVEQDLLGVNVVLDVELLPAGLVDEAHLDDADAVGKGGVGEQGGGDVGGGADNEDGEGAGLREGAGSLEEEADGGAGAGGVGVSEGEAAALDEGRVGSEVEAVLDDVAEDAERGAAGGGGNGGGVGAEDAADVEAGLEQEPGDGPLVVDLVADVGGEDDGGAGGWAWAWRGGVRQRVRRRSGRRWRVGGMRLLGAVAAGGYPPPPY